MSVVDRVFGVLLLVGTVGHTIGTVVLLGPGHDAFIWSLGSSVASGLIGTLNLVRASRPADRTIAVITAVSSAVWIGIAFGFGASIGNVLDPRALFHAVVGAGLALLSLRTLVRANGHLAHAAG